jgi:hypothetical protein
MASSGMPAARSDTLSKALFDLKVDYALKQIRGFINTN